MKILGIDPSTKMGLVVLDHEGDTIKTLYKGEYRSKQTGMPRLGDIGERVVTLVDEYKPELIGLEGYSYGSKYNHEAMYSVGTVIRYFLWQFEHEYKEVAPGTLKKFVTGKGNAKKDLMLISAFKNWGFDTTSDNVADAYGLAMFVLFEHLGIATEKGDWKKGDAKHLTIL